MAANNTSEQKVLQQRESKEEQTISLRQITPTTADDKTNENVFVFDMHTQQLRSLHTVTLYISYLDIENPGFVKSVSYNINGKTMWHFDDSAILKFGRLPFVKQKISYIVGRKTCKYALKVYFDFLAPNMCIGHFDKEQIVFVLDIPKISSSSSFEPLVICRANVGKKPLDVPPQVIDIKIPVAIPAVKPLQYLGSNKEAEVKFIVAEKYLPIDRILSFNFETIRSMKPEKKKDGVSNDIEVTFIGTLNNITDEIFCIAMTAGKIVIVKQKQ